MAGHDNRPVPGEGEWPQLSDHDFGVTSMVSDICSTVISRGYTMGEGDGEQH